MVIRYRNFQGQEKTFNVDATSATRVKNHIKIRVAPHGLAERIFASKGQVITLSRDRILNLAEVESAITERVAPGQAWPTPHERQVLTYHKKRGSTSPLYETIRAKYPNW